MADKNFDQLPTVSSVGATDPIPLNQGGVTSSATAPLIVAGGTLGAGPVSVQLGDSAVSGGEAAVAIGSGANAAG